MLTNLLTRSGQRILALLIIFTYIFILRLFGSPIPIILFISALWFIFRGIFIFAISPNLAKSFLLSILIFIPGIFLSVYSAAFNGSSDFSGITYAFSRMGYLLASFCVCDILVVFCSINTFKSLLTVIVNAGMLQVIISVLMFFVPTISSFFMGIQTFDDTAATLANEVLGFRIIGFGAYFFGGGVLFALFILLTAQLMIESKKDIILVKYIIIYVLLTLVGIAIARTASIGILLTLIFIIVRKKYKFLLGFVSSLVLIFIILLGSILYLNENILDSNTIRFMFELPMNYIESGSLSSSSTDQLKSMYILPHNISTYLIGDGYFIDKEYGSYYKDIDVGFLRVIYYTGIPGLICYLCVGCFFINKLRKSKFADNNIAFFVILSCFFILVNLKGFYDFVAIFGLLYAFVSYKEYARPLKFKSIPA